MPIKPSKKQSAFDKRLKRRISGRTHDFFAVCPPGLESICKQELTELAEAKLPGSAPDSNPEIKEITLLSGGVGFQTRLHPACLVNMFLGTPTKILMRIASFKAERFSALEKQIKAIDWELYLPKHHDLDIQVTCRKSRLYHSDAVAERCYPIIKSRIENFHREHPQPGDDSPETYPGKQTLMIRADQDRFELSLNMSGDLLFKRGIKQKVIQAPLRENLAFAILRALEFSGEDTLVDPMCGSGTFSMEGAMMQSNVPPGFFRSFAFESWPGFQEKRFAHSKKQIQDKFSPKRVNKIFASDLDTKAVAGLGETCLDHEFLNQVQTQCQDFFTIRPPEVEPGKGVIILNPPYGKRLGQDINIHDFFKGLGNKLSRDFSGWRVAVIYPDKQVGAAMNLHLKPMPFFHGGLDLFAGIGTLP